MKRIKLSLRRFRGWAAYTLLMAIPTRFERLWWPLLPWAGVYAHYDCAEAAVARDALAQEPRP